MAPVVPIAIVVALALIGGGKKSAPAPAPSPGPGPTPTPGPAPTPAKPATPATSPTAAYKDANGVMWAISNPTPGTWVGMLTAAPVHPLYASGIPFMASTRAGIEQQIDQRAQVVKESGGL
jgi:hypothetical protein